MPALDLSEYLCIHYEEANPSGSPPVLLLHGLGSAGADWALQLEALAEAGYRVLAPDLRGFGRSSAPPEVTVEAMAEDMALFLRKLDALPAHVVGISMGGAVALQLALEHPEAVRKLVLVNTFARLRPRNLGEALYFLARMLIATMISPQKQAAMVAKRIFPRPEHEPLRQKLYSRIRHTNPCAYKAAMASLRRFNVMHRLGELKMPTLVITGSADTSISPQSQKEMAGRIPGARQVVIEGAGHAVIADSPEAFNRALLDFLEDG